MSTKYAVATVSMVSTLIIIQLHASHVKVITELKEMNVRSMVAAGDQL